MFCIKIEAVRPFIWFQTNQVALNLKRCFHQNATAVNGSWNTERHAKQRAVLNLHNLDIRTSKAHAFPDPCTVRILEVSKPRKETHQNSIPVDYGWTQLRQLSSVQCSNSMNLATELQKLVQLGSEKTPDPCTTRILLNPRPLERYSPELGRCRSR